MSPWLEWHHILKAKYNFLHKKHQMFPYIKSNLAVPIDRYHYSPPSWMTIEFTVASEVRRNISPSLITTCFAESCPGSQFLRRGFWSGQFSIKQCKDIPLTQQQCKDIFSQIQALSPLMADLLQFLSIRMEIPSHPMQQRYVKSFTSYTRQKGFTTKLSCYHLVQVKLHQVKMEFPLNHLLWK